MNLLMQIEFTSNQPVWFYPRSSYGLNGSRAVAPSTPAPCLGGRAGVALDTLSWDSVKWTCVQSMLPGLCICTVRVRGFSELSDAHVAHVARDAERREPL